MNTTGHKSAGMNINLKKGKVGITASYNLMGNDGLRTTQLALTTSNQPIAFARREVGGNRETDLFFQSGKPGA